MKETDAIDEYILQHIDEESDYLKALYRDTHVKLLRPRMASGHLQGRMLKMFVQMIRPRQVLEIGTYSGYSALCLAEGLEEGATLHTFEINDDHLLSVSSRSDEVQPLRCPSAHSYETAVQNPAKTFIFMIQ